MFDRFLANVAALGDKAGFGAMLVAGMGCAACFPALAGLGAAIGLGFLHQYEGVFVGTLIPLLAWLVLLLNALAWLVHRQWHRSLMGVIGPVLILIGAARMSETFFYSGLALMFAVSVWDLVAARLKRRQAAAKP